MQWPQVSMFNGELDVGMSAKNELMAGFFFMLDNSYKHVCVCYPSARFKAGVRAFMRDPVEGNRYLLDFDLFGVDN